MKKVLLLLLSASVVLFCVPASAQTTEKANKTRTNNNADAAKLNGSWQSVDDRTFVMLYDNFYSQITQDSTGKLGYVESGTYINDGSNTITLNVRYAFEPSHIGSLHTVEYEMNGETLTVKSFKRLLDAKQVDITAQMPKGQQVTFKRAKK